MNLFISHLDICSIEGPVEGNGVILAIFDGSSEVWDVLLNGQSHLCVMTRFSLMESQGHCTESGPKYCNTNVYKDNDLVGRSKSEGLLQTSH